MRLAVFVIFHSFAYPRVVRSLAAVAASAMLVAITCGADDSPAPIGPISSAVPSRLEKSADGAKDPRKPTEQRIEQLIRELGSPQFPTRRAAAQELRQIGAEAFDQLFAATDSSDPEIAASAGYLLRQVPVRWYQPEDAGAVR